MLDHTGGRHGRRGVRCDRAALRRRALDGHGRSPAFPGPLPADLAAAYAVQEAAIGLWPDAIAGWKVGLIGRDQVADLQAGPARGTDLRPSACARRPRRRSFAFRSSRVDSRPSRPSSCCGSGETRRADKLEWTRAEAAELVADVHVGVETAGSPLATINAIGPRCDRCRLRQQRGAHRRPRAAAAGARGPSRSGVAESFVDDVERRPRPRRRRAGRTVRVAALPARAQRAARAAAEGRRLGVDGRADGRARHSSRGRRRASRSPTPARSCARPWRSRASARGADGAVGVVTRRRFVAGVAAGAAAAACRAARSRAVLDGRGGASGRLSDRRGHALDRRAARRRASPASCGCASITRGSSAARRTRSSLRGSARWPSRACTAPCVNNAIPATRILSLPYVFDSTEHMRRAFDGSFGDEILAACARRGLLGLAIYDSGSRNFYNTRRAVEAPSDLHGLKLRVPQSDIFMESVAALGASPTPLAYSTVFSSLQTHLIDGAENNWPSYFSSRHFEIARYWSESRACVRARPAADVAARGRCACRKSNARSSSRPRAARCSSCASAGTRPCARRGARRSTPASCSNAIDTDAFRRAVQPMLDRHLRDAETRRLYDELRGFAAA